MIVDGKNAVLGRLAVGTAKKLMSGEEVQIFNAEKVIITGRPNLIKEKYLARRARGNPHHGPFFPRMPHLIVRRTIRGMLPYKTNKGRAAFKKLRVYNGAVPKGTDKAEALATKPIRSRYITVGELAKALGWNE